MAVMTIIYHDDADGRCAAAIAGQDAKKRRMERSYIPAEYGKSFDWGLLDGYDPAADEVWLLDFSLPAEDMDRMWRMADGRFVWIDHHVTAIEKLADFAGVSGIRNTQRAACRLVWAFCCDLNQPPLAVRLIADRDVWRFEYGETAKHFHEAFWNVDTEPWQPVWKKWLRHDCRLAEELAQGAVLYGKKKRGLMSTLSRLGRIEKLNGTDLTVLTANCMGTGDLGEAAREMGHSVLHCYVEQEQNGRLVRVHNLYSNDVDVGELAKIRGGGGHREAAGWVEVVK